MKAVTEFVQVSRCSTNRIETLNDIHVYLYEALTAAIFACKLGGIRVAKPAPWPPMPGFLIADEEAEGGRGGRDDGVTERGLGDADVLTEGGDENEVLVGDVVVGEDVLAADVPSGIDVTVALWAGAPDCAVDVVAAAEPGCEEVDMFADEEVAGDCNAEIPFDDGASAAAAKSRDFIFAMVLTSLTICVVSVLFELASDPFKSAIDGSDEGSPACVAEAALSG